MKLSSVLFTISLLSHRPAQATSRDWQDLNIQVGGRLLKGVPISTPCFSDVDGVAVNPNLTACNEVKAGYDDELVRSDVPGAYMITQWETCQSSNQQCLLDYLDPENPAPSLPSQMCRTGSVPHYFIDVHTAADVIAAFNFSRKTSIPLVIKNTGHDYKGRSSAPGSLALWTHNLKNITYSTDFVPEGCSKSSPALTVGAGVQWQQAYQFADTHNFTIVGGTDRTVGVSGGWVQGGGHSALSNTMGLGVDRVLQFKIVTPDGKVRVANACQNTDLFWALRGGGGGTFGVVLESTTLVSPVVTVQAILVSITSPSANRTKELYSTMIDNGLKWADDGYGGYVSGGTAVYLTPKLTAAEHAVSMAPLVDFGKRLNATGTGVYQVLEFPNWLSFFNVFTETELEAQGPPVGYSIAMASRLVNRANFQTASKRTELLDALLAATELTPSLLFDITAPSSFPGDNTTSVTPVWRDSVYHVTVKVPWNWNATTTEKLHGYDLVDTSIDHLRKITPTASYSNEGAVHEPDHEIAFWGGNYARLLELKHKYDPEHILDCWQCVGWEPTSLRFSCYL
ncbi:FAD-binding domain-containing protein [Mycena rosella]|uniref:FAD-binding domain-containing protein n=1 Tax=Mycena rosella TaxID=1033263 RepID=A0AAD7GXD2_MYCRO|nr:FAD-binding domain-containing protein [Mycena rosella]